MSDLLARLLHVCEALSRFSYVHRDPRFQEMLDTLTAQDGKHRRYTARSVYLSWKGWSFAGKKTPSPWLTCLAQYIQQRGARPQRRAGRDCQPDVVKPA